LRKRQCRPSSLFSDFPTSQKTQGPSHSVMVSFLGRFGIILKQGSLLDFAVVFVRHVLGFDKRTSDVLVLRKRHEVTAGYLIVHSTLNKYESGGGGKASRRGPCATSTATCNSPPRINLLQRRLSLFTEYIVYTAMAQSAEAIRAYASLLAQATIPLVLGSFKSLKVSWRLL